MALGAAAKSRMSMGIVIIGGTLFSLILTLYVIPAVYSMWSKKHKALPEITGKVEPKPVLEAELINS